MKKGLLMLLFTIVISIVITITAYAEQEGLFEYKIEDSYAIITDCNTNLTDIYVPKTLGGYTVSEIDLFCFSDCANMESISLPDTITSIGSFAFDETNKLKTVYFSGTESQWKGISIGIFNDNLINAEIHYNSTNEIIDYITYNGFTVQNNVLISYTGNETEVVIPQNIEGHPVLCIGQAAFSSNKQMESLIIPEGVTNIDSSAFYQCGNLVTVTLPESLESIGNFAFDNCSNLTEVTFANGLKNIGDSAFSNCRNLQIVNLPQSLTNIGNYAFSNCIKLTEIQIPSKITIINSKTFSNCPSLKNIYLGNNIEKIDSYAFNNCPALSQVYYDGSQSEWQEVIIEEDGNSFFVECVKQTLFSGPIFSKGELTDTLTWEINDQTLTINGSGDMPDWYLPDFSFVPTSPPWYRSADIIENVVIGKGVTNIGIYAFYECCNLRSIQISDTVSKIGAWAFRQCLQLSNINIDSSNPYLCCIDQVIYNKDMTNLIYYAAEKAQKEFHTPDTIKTIALGAFYHNQHLVNLYLNKGITALSSSIIYTCPSLSSISIPETVNDISGTITVDCVNLKNYTVSPDNPFYATSDGIIFNKNKTKIVKYPQGKTNTAYTIPPEITTIEESAFDYCHNLISIYVPNGVTTIREGAFSYCDNLQNVYIPPTVTKFESRMFFGCTNLSNVIFLSNTGNMGVEGFYGCYNLKNIYYGGSKEQWEKLSQYSGVEYIQGLSVKYNQATTPIVSAVIDKNDSCTLFNILTCNIPENSSVIVALYNNEQLSDIKLFDSDDQYKLHESTSASDKIKIMVWDNSKSFKPLLAPIIK